MRRGSGKQWTLKEDQLNSTHMQISPHTHTHHLPKPAHPTSQTDSRHSTLLHFIRWRRRRRIGDHEEEEDEEEPVCLWVHSSVWATCCCCCCRPHVGWSVAWMARMEWKPTESSTHCLSDIGDSFAKLWNSNLFLVSDLIATRSVHWCL